jgi:hypothetical protein
MSVVEGRADIKDLRLEVYFNRNQARRQTFGAGGGQFSGAKRVRTGGLIRTQKVQFFRQKPHFGGRKLQDDTYRHKASPRAFQLLTDAVEKVEN